MPNTYTQIYLHFIFAVESKQNIISKTWKDELYKYITGTIQHYNHKLIAINGVSDHIHILIGYNQNQLIPDLLQDIKGSSSKWINEKKLVKGKFNWQTGYGTFSYSRSQIDKLIKYINNQEKHHEKITFRQEYIDFLEKFNVDYDERYIFKDIE